MVRPPVTEEELNSEVELIKSEDVLRLVVLANGLQNRKSLSYYIFGMPDERTGSRKRSTGWLAI